MPQGILAKPLTLNRTDLDILCVLSLKGYRFLTCHHLKLLYFAAEADCMKRMTELCEMGLTARLFTPTSDVQKQEAIYTLTRFGARQLAILKGISSLGLASTGKPSYLFLEHGLRVSDFMCSLEAATKPKGIKLACWKSERQLRSPRGRALKIPHPFEAGDKISVIPDGLFSLEIDKRVEHFFLEADRGTMSLFTMRNKLLGYIQLYRRRLHQEHFNIPHFRVLLVTNTLYRINKLREILRKIGYCPNMFWFAVWKDISPEKILSKIWLKCREQEQYSFLEIKHK